MPRRLLAALGPVAVLLLAACSTTTGRTTSGSPVWVTGTRATGTRATGTSPGPGPSIAHLEEPVAVDPARYHLVRDEPDGSLYLLSDGVSFRTPSGNIRCDVIGTDDLVCVIGRESFRLPARPDSCDHNWEASTVSLGKNGVELGLCAGGEVVHYAGTVLPYGRALTSGRITCASEPTGLTCRLAGTAHSFTLSRAALRTA